MATDSRKDDDKDRHMPVHNGGGDTLRRIEVITGTGRRRRWDAETKGRLVAESFEPGCSVSEVARRHDISPGLLFLWRRQAAAAVCPHAARWPTMLYPRLFVRPSRSTAGGRGHGGQYRDGDAGGDRGTARQTAEAARKESRARGQEGAAGRGLRMRRAPGNQRPKRVRPCRAQAGRPSDGTRWDTGTRRRRPAAQAGAAAENRARWPGVMLRRISSRISLRRSSSFSSA